MNENKFIQSYQNYLFKHFNVKERPKSYLKPTNDLHFSTSNLYYYFDMNNPEFNKSDDTLLANLDLFKKDLFDDLEETSELYHINPDGSFTLSK